MVRFKMYYSKVEKQLYAFWEDKRVAVKKVAEENILKDCWGNPEDFIKGRPAGAFNWTYMDLPNRSIPKRSEMRFIWYAHLSDDGRRVLWNGMEHKDGAPKKRSQSIMDITRGFCK